MNRRTNNIPQNVTSNLKSPHRADNNKSLSITPLKVCIRAWIILVVVASVYLIHQTSLVSREMIPVETSGFHMLIQDNSFTASSTINPQKHISANNNSQQQQEETPKKQIAYAISITSCSPTVASSGSKEATNPHMVDAAAILRHSIHLVHQKSQYDFAMHVFVYQDNNNNNSSSVSSEAEVMCGQELERLGYTVQMVPTPIQVEQIRNMDLQKHVQDSGCCGEREFLKLYSLTLTQYAAVIHLDLDSMVLKPLDDYLNIMLHNNNRDDNDNGDGIQAMYTRDYGMGNAGVNLTRIGVQGGFWMVRPSMAVFDELREIILDGANFEQGHGWGEKELGKSWYYGVAQIQGLLSYYYTSVHPQSGVELNRCYINVMADQPNHDICSNETIAKANANAIVTDHQSSHLVAEQRPYHYCQDCSQTPLSEVYIAHFTRCQKPYTCRSLDDSSLCLQLHYKWHEIRNDLEHQWSTTRNTNKEPPPRYTIDQITQYRDVMTAFQEHCWGTDQYKPMKIPKDIINI